MKVYQGKLMTDIEVLKVRGYYGTTSDPFWNPKKRRHDCCGATKSFYHKKGCRACQPLE